MIINAANLARVYTGFKAAFNEGFRTPTTDWPQIATLVPSSTKIETYAWLGQFPKLREWIGARVLQTIEGEAYQLINRDFESTVSIDANDIEDDQFGIYAPLMKEMGHAAAVHPDELVFDTLCKGFSGLCYDGKPFFAENHSVAGKTVSNMQAGTEAPWFLLDTSRSLKPLIFQKRKDYNFVQMTRPDDEQVFMSKQYRYGVDARVTAGYGFWQMAYASRAPLTPENFDLARKSMRKIASDQGRPLGIRPTLLVVGPQYESAANRLLKSELVSEDGAAVSNIYKGAVDLLVSPWI